MKALLAIRGLFHDCEIFANLRLKRSSNHRVTNPQENVETGKRGVINGVQTSICSGFDLVKFSLVLVMPQENMFGLLVILSYLFICAGALCYFTYVAREPPRQSTSSSARYHQAAQSEHAQSEKVSLRTID